MFRYAFRLHRWGVIGFSAFFALDTVAIGATYAKLAGSTSATRTIFAHQMTVLGPQFSYLVPLPHQPDTLAGYLLWKAWDSLPIAVAVWAIAAAAAAVRGDEERRLVDSWIAARASRTRIVVARMAAFAAAAAIASLAAGLGSVAGAGKGVDGVAVDHALGQSLVLWLLAMDLYALCFLASQVPATKRAAQGLCALLVLVLFVAASAARSVKSLAWIGWLSPFGWFEASYPLPSAGHLDQLALALAAATALAASGLAAALFLRRDVGGPLLRLRRREAASAVPATSSPLLGWPVVRLCYRRRWMLFTWTVSIVVLAAYLVAISRQVVDAMVSVPGMRSYLSAFNVGDAYVGFIAIFWFGIAQLLITGYAIHLVSSWASDDGEGILAAELSRPRRRWGVVAERFSEALLGVALIAVVGSITAALVARSFGTTLDAGGVTRATALLVPFALTYTAVGAVGSVWWPRASVGVLGVVVILSYLLNELGPIVKLPTLLLDLSPFSLYGTPLVTGVYWTGFYVMVAVVAAGYTAATFLMQRRDLA